MNSLLHLARTPRPPGLIAPFAAAALLVAGGRVLVRRLRRAWEATDADALAIVLDPRAAAQRAEQKLTSRLLDGSLDGQQYRSLLAALAHDHMSAIQDPETSFDPMHGPRTGRPEI